MLDGENPATRAAVRELEFVVEHSSKRIIFWLGAGTSRWAGLPTWQELADIAVGEFRRFETSFDQEFAAAILKDRDFPALFQYLRDLNRQRLNLLLSKALAAPASTPVFGRFVGLLSGVNPLKVITTNFDDALAIRPGVRTLHRSDIDAAIRALTDNSEFLLKLHGTIGAIETCVVTTKDYEDLVSQGNYLELTKQLFLHSHVVFFGTSLSDEYVLDLLSKAAFLRWRIEGTSSIFCKDPIHTEQTVL
jgi:NAD-dependent SIR2 family protein deacetylase